MLQTQHWDPHIRVAHRDQIRRNAIQLIPENYAYGESWSPVEQIDRVNGSLDHCQFVPLAAEFRGGFKGAFGMFPRYGVFGPERRLQDAFMWRKTRNPAQDQSFDA